MSQTLTDSIFKNFQSNGALWQTFKQKFPLFIAIKAEIFVWEFVTKLHLIKIFLKIGSVTQEMFVREIIVIQKMSVTFLRICILIV